MCILFTLWFINRGPIFHVREFLTDLPGFHFIGK